MSCPRPFLPMFAHIHHAQEDNVQKKWNETEDDNIEETEEESLGLGTRLEAQLQGCLEDLDNLKKIADSKEGEKLVEALGDIKE